MAVEQNETNEIGNASGQKPEIPLPARPEVQTALAFAPDGTAQMVAEPADAHDGRRRGKRQPRFDVRRTAEYLAERGPLPQDMLHKIARRDPADHVRWFRKQFKGISDADALAFWRWAVEELLPYTAIKAAEIDQPSLLPSSPGGMHGHFLAASMASLHLAHAGSGAASPGLSIPQRGIDSFVPSAPADNTAQFGRVIDGTPAHTPSQELDRVRVAMPPKGKD